MSPNSVLEFRYHLDDIDHAAEKVLKFIAQHLQSVRGLEADNSAFAKADNIPPINRAKLLFTAEMGAGKTTLIKAILKRLGIPDFEGSPTFSIVNEYKTENLAIHHFDLYRIESEEELEEMGFTAYLEKPALQLIEWPDIAKEFLDNQVFIVDQKLDDSTTRTLTISRID